MYGIAYGENNPSALLDKARPLAVADAKRKAEIYAEAGGAKIGRLMSLTEQPVGQPVQFATRRFRPGRRRGADADRGRRRQAHRRHHGAIRADAVTTNLGVRGRPVMCRNIRPLFNFEPPASEDEIRASALQFVRKVSGFSKPSQANAEAFDRAVDEVTEAARRLIGSLHSAAPPRDRETEALKARERGRRRFA